VGPGPRGLRCCKRDLKAGEVLDDYGMYMTYGEAVNVHEMSEQRYLPEGLLRAVSSQRDITKDAVLTYDDVDLPPNRLADRLRPSNIGTSVMKLAGGAPRGSGLTALIFLATRTLVSLIRTILDGTAFIKQFFINHRVQPNV